MTASRILEVKGSEVFTLPPETATMDAVKSLREHKIGALIVSSGNGKIDGILSERDIVRAIANHGAEALTSAVSAHMTKDVVTCAESATIPELMELMTKGRFRHVPVARDGKLVGIISIGDVVKRRIAEVEAEAEEIKSYISSV
ncbi:CBS domain-containing protein [Ahrensia marina]|uniref:Inosine-5-monophosphate dehydrogenase n=1 Tax=Ahrensia marina TaxID=1514904 RepID=A0A0N0VLP4_9HYPH|nr:CBS domain-containing protein [Ahrensia marina]KPB01694.1 inosine-5-monophosphate dehydrogenase [Ahrensia marina]